MKGVHPVLSHSIMLMLGLTAMGLITFSVSASLLKTERGLVSAEIDFFANSVKNDILEVYSLVNSSNFSEGTFKVKLPERIGNRKYAISLSDNYLSVSTDFRGDTIGTTLALPIDAEMNGTSLAPTSLSVGKENGEITIGLIE